MIVRKATENEMEKALAIVNEKYNQNVTWKRFNPKGKGFQFTLRVLSSKGTGAKVSHTMEPYTGKTRRSVASCWHVHGDFFDALFSVAPSAYVWSGGRKIDKNQGNWQDRNIGSIMYPFLYSDSCECKNSSVLQGVK